MPKTINKPTDERINVSNKKKRLVMFPNDIINATNRDEKLWGLSKTDLEGIIGALNKKSKADHLNNEATALSDDLFTDNYANSDILQMERDLMIDELFQELITANPKLKPKETLTTLKQWYDLPSGIYKNQIVFGKFDWNDEDAWLKAGFSAVPNEIKAAYDGFILKIRVDVMIKRDENTYDLYFATASTTNSINKALLNSLIQTALKYSDLKDKTVNLHYYNVRYEQAENSDKAIPLINNNTFQPTANPTVPSVVYSVKDVNKFLKDCVLVKWEDAKQHILSKNLTAFNPDPKHDDQDCYVCDGAVYSVDFIQKLKTWVQNPTGESEIIFSEKFMMNTSRNTSPKAIEFIVLSTKDYVSFVRQNKLGLIKGSILDNTGDQVLASDDFDITTLHDWDNVKNTLHKATFYLTAFNPKNELTVQSTALTNDADRKITLQQVSEVAYIIGHNLLTLHTKKDVKQMQNATPNLSDQDKPDSLAFAKALYKEHANHEYCYTPFAYSTTVLPYTVQYFMYELLKAYNIQNDSEFQTLINDDVRVDGMINQFRDEYLAYLNKLNKKSDAADKLFPLNKDESTGKDFSTYLKLINEQYLPNKNVSVELDQGTLYNLKDSVFGDILVPAQFNDQMNEWFANTDTLLWFDFETLATYIQVVKGQIGKAQLPTQVSINVTDKNAKYLAYLDKVIDPAHFGIKDFADVVMDLYYVFLKSPNTKAIVYNDSFENNRLFEMIDYFPDDFSYEYTPELLNANGKLYSKEKIKVDKAGLVNAIHTIVDHTVDLMDFFSNRNDSKNMSMVIKSLKGYYSIKYLESFVLKYYEKHPIKTSNPVLGPVSYADLTINKGDKATYTHSSRLLGAIKTPINSEGYPTLYRDDVAWSKAVMDLKKYCHNDVEMMIGVYVLLKDVGRQLAMVQNTDEFFNAQLEDENSDELDLQNDQAMEPVVKKVKIRRTVKLESDTLKDMDEFLIKRK